MEGQFEGHPSAALADRSRTQHQGGAASITPRPAGVRRPNGIFVNAMNSINDGDLSVAVNSVSSISCAGTGDNTYVSTVMKKLTNERTSEAHHDEQETTSFPR